MITLSRLNGNVVAINPDLVTWVDVTPDTTVSMLGGEKIIVRDSLQELIDRVVAYRRAIGAAGGHPPPREAFAPASRRDSGAFRAPVDGDAVGGGRRGDG